MPHSGYMWSTLRALLELLLELLFGGGPLPPSRLTVVTKLDKPRLAAARGAFVDGAVLADGSCGAAVFYSAGHELNTHGRLTLPAGAPADSNLAELAALAHCLLRHPRGEPLAVFSDSMHALRCAQAAAESGGGGRGRGRRRVSDQTQDGRWGGLVLLIQLLLRLRRGRTAFFKVQAHKGNRSNEIADALAQKGAGGDGSPLPLPAFSGGSRRHSEAACEEGAAQRLAVNRRPSLRSEAEARRVPVGAQLPALAPTRGAGGGCAARARPRRQQAAPRRRLKAPSAPGGLAARRRASAADAARGGGGRERRGGGRRACRRLRDGAHRARAAPPRACTAHLAGTSLQVGVGASGLPSKLASVCVVNEAERPRRPARHLPASSAREAVCGSVSQVSRKCLGSERPATARRRRLSTFRTAGRLAL